MASGAKKTYNVSLYIYTALIFLAAIFIVVFSYFSQESVERKKKELLGDETSYTSISDKISKLSDENRVLLTTTQDLEQKNSDLEAKNEELATIYDDAKNELDTIKKLLKVSDLLEEGKKEAATEIFNEISTEGMSDDATALYEKIKTKIEK